MSIKELTEVISPPEAPLEVRDEAKWKRVEGKIRIALPKDFKDYIDTYGSGLLGNFILVFNPYSNGELSFLKNMKRLCEVLRINKEHEPDTFSFEVFSDKPGILPWGTDGNGNTLAWLTKGAPSKWPVVVLAGRDSQWQQFEMPMSTFLARVFKREISCKIWPNDFPGRKKRGFEPRTA